MRQYEPGETTLPEPAGMVGDPTVTLPNGYRFGVTRYADVILRDSFARRFAELVEVLEEYSITAAELVAGGGNRAAHTRRFDELLEAYGWGKRKITISKFIDGRPIHTTPGHEIDMFGSGPHGDQDPYPGVAVEMEWNNKDPFYDRDLLNFQALHREGAMAVGVIVTRGPALQDIIQKTVLGKGATEKFGRSTTHWKKLVPRVNLGGGGECPLLLVGIEPDRINGFEVIRQAHAEGRRLRRGDTL